MINYQEVSLFNILITGIGLLSSVAVIIGLIISYHRNSPKLFLLSGSVGLLSTLLIMGLSCIAYLHDRLLLQTDITRFISFMNISISDKLTKIPITIFNDSITLGLQQSLIPLLLGVHLIVRGFIGSSDFSAEQRKITPIIATISMTIGIGLAFFALVDYLRFGDFFNLLMMISTWGG